MSIIYEALKKAEKNVDATAAAPQKKSEKSAGPKPKTYLIYFLVISVGLFLANFVFSYLTASQKKKPLAQKSVPALTTVKPALPTPVLPSAAQKTFPAHSGRAENQPPDRMVLSGVFFSESDGYALINDTIVRNGDTVDGAVVKKIDLEVVELEYQGKTIRLYNR